MPDTKIIYVVAFAPDFTNWHGDNARVGGFDWYATWESASRGVLRHLYDGQTGHDLVMRAVQVPRELNGPEITGWLDERHELFEVPIPEEWVT